MPETNRFALKEWAVVMRAKATGCQVILLREGGAEDGALPFSSGIGDAD